MANTDNQEFSEAFKSVENQPVTADTDYDNEIDSQTKQAVMSLSTHQSDIGTRLHSEWQEAKTNRRFDERRFVRALRQYRGIYDPEVAAAIDTHRSSAYIRLTRTKVKTYDSRMMDLKFPANEDKDWSIKPTPVPELSPMILKDLAEQIYAVTGKIPTEAEIKDIVYKQADKQAKEMEKEIADQLTDCDYRTIIRDVIHSGHIYGTGVLKGPMVTEKTSYRWHQLPDGQWKRLHIKRLIPTASFVPIWDIYPEASAKEIKDCRYVWQKHQFSKNNLFKLSKRDDFDGEAIRAFMEAYPEGNSVYTEYEEDFREMSSNSRSDGDSQVPKKEKYEVHERWGFMDIEDAKMVLPNVDEQTWSEMGPEVACSIWQIDGYIIKAILSPVESAKIPYYFYYYDKDETSIFGDGIPEIMRDPQQLYNASIRAMLDNAAISAGPIIEANVDMLADGEDPTELFPFRTFQRIGTGIEANAQAIRVTKLPSYTNEFLNLVGFFQQAADESTTIPRSMSGSAEVTGAAARTATGMSMLMGAANVTLKDQVHSFDEGVTTKFIKAMYFWNMEFNDKDTIKGDFDIVARGSKSMIAKEVKMEQLNQFLALTGNELDRQFIKRDVLLRELAEVLDLDGIGFIKSEAEVTAANQATGAANEKRQQVEMLLEGLKAQSSGHAPNAVEMIQQIMSGQQPGGANPINPKEIQGSNIG